MSISPWSSLLVRNEELQESALRPYPLGSVQITGQASDRTEVAFILFIIDEGFPTICRTRPLVNEGMKLASPSSTGKGCQEDDLDRQVSQCK